MSTAALISIVLLTLVPADRGGDQSDTRPASVAGTWTLTVKGSGAHGDMTAGLSLEQEGAKVTGKFSAHGMEIDVAGDFTDGTLSLSTQGSDSNHQVTFTARLESDGTLAGSASGPMGDMSWTGSRVKDK